MSNAPEPTIEDSMTAYILMDELHIQTRVPRTLSASDLAVIRRYLAGRLFHRRLVRAVRSTFAGASAMASVRVRIVR
jgi:hypothetical protein